MTESTVPSPPISPTGLLRRGSAQKKELKEKVVQIYEAFFRGEDPSYKNAQFWDEFFLLKVNGTYLETEFKKMNGEQLIRLKESINLLFSKCISMLKQTNQIRVISAMQTLCALIRGIYSKSHISGYDMINILIGFDSAEFQMQSLSESVNQFLSSPDCSTNLKSMSLKLLLTILAANDNISQNTMLEYLMINSIYEALIQILASPGLRQQHGKDVVSVLTLLVNYRKYESVNPYIVKLSILSDELALNGYALVVSATLADFNRQQVNGSGSAVGGGGNGVESTTTTTTASSPTSTSGGPAGSQPAATATQAAAGTSSWLTSFTNMVGSLLVSAPDPGSSVGSVGGMSGGSCEQRVARTDCMLLALYEAIHLNRNFITTLTHTTTENSNPPSPTSEANTLTSSNPASPNSTSNTAASGDVVNIHVQPTNLLVTFLEYTSIVLKEAKDDGIVGDTAKLCFIILVCIAEDQYANSLMHDANMNFRVHLHRMPMRHRKATVDKNPPSRPLACALLDLMVEFIMSHLMKHLPVELYSRCLGVCHRVLCYQKRCRVRLHYAWKDLWNALISLLKFMLNHEAALVTRPDHNIFSLAIQVMQIFNLFITYGDTFLPSPSSYDELYYEVMRCHQTFDTLYSCALRYTHTSASAAVPGTMVPHGTSSSTAGSAGDSTAPNMENKHRESATRLLTYLTNVRAISNHFTPKIEQWAAANHMTSLTEQQVLNVVRTNYDTLNLKLQESLDQYQRYSEEPREAQFFTLMVRCVISEYRRCNPLSSLTYLYTTAHHTS